MVVVVSSFGDAFFISRDWETGPKWMNTNTGQSSENKNSGLHLRLTVFAKKNGQIEYLWIGRARSIRLFLLNIWV